MTQFRVFLGAPSQKALRQESTESSYHWQTISTSSRSFSAILPPATLEAASRRISRIYENIIFNDAEEEGLCCNEEDDDGALYRVIIIDKWLNLATEQTNLISWLPTEPRDASSRHIEGPTVSFLDISSVSRARLLEETQETQETASYNYSDASSIVHFPAFHFNLHTLTSLSSLVNNKSSRKFSVLLVALEVEGPDSIRTKKGVHAGEEVSILKMILGDVDGQVCKLTAWREIAETWGGAGDSPAVKRGDVVWIESALLPPIVQHFPNRTTSLLTIYLQM